MTEVFEYTFVNNKSNSPAWNPTDFRSNTGCPTCSPLETVLLPGDSVSFTSCWMTSTMQMVFVVAAKPMSYVPGFEGKSSDAPEQCSEILLSEVWCRYIELNVRLVVSCLSCRLWCPVSLSVFGTKSGKSLIQSFCWGSELFNKNCGRNSCVGGRYISRPFR